LPPIFLVLYFLDLNVGEIEKLRSQQMELEEVVANLEECVKKFQDEERSLVNQAANLRKQWVCCWKFILS